MSKFCFLKLNESNCPKVCASFKVFNYFKKLFEKWYQDDIIKSFEEFSNTCVSEVDKDWIYLIRSE